MNTERICPNWRKPLPQGLAPPATASWLWILALTVVVGIILIALGGLRSRWAVMRASASRDVSTTASVNGAQNNNSQTDSSTNSNDPAIDVGDNPNYSRSFIVAPSGLLTMNVDCGNISIVGTNQNTVEIQVDREVTRASASDAAKILNEEQVMLKQSGNDISITAQDPPSLQDMSSSRGKFATDSGMRPNLSVHYQITVPRQFQVQSETAGGNIEVASLDGRVNIRTAGGNLDCENIAGDVDGKTDGGNIKASGIHGSVTLKTAGGRLYCKNIAGSLDARTDGGDIHAGKCQGPLNLKTSGGNVSIDGFVGPNIQADTDGGNVAAEFVVAPKSDSGLSSAGGNVMVRLPENAAVTLDAHTDGGAIRTEFPVQREGEISGDTLKGTINGGGPILKLNSAGGNIELRKGAVAGQIPAGRPVQKQIQTH